MPLCCTPGGGEQRSTQAQPAHVWVAADGHAAALQVRPRTPHHSRQALGLSRCWAQPLCGLTCAVVLFSRRRKEEDAQSSREKAEQKQAALLRVRPVLSACLLPAYARFCAASARASGSPLHSHCAALLPCLLAGCDAGALADAQAEQREREESQRLRQLEKAGNQEQRREELVVSIKLAARLPARKLYPFTLLQTASLCGKLFFPSAGAVAGTELGRGRTGRRPRSRRFSLSCAARWQWSMRSAAPPSC